MRLNAGNNQKSIREEIKRNIKKNRLLTMIF